MDEQKTKLNNIPGLGDETEIDPAKVRIMVLLKDGSACWVTMDKLDEMRADGILAED